MTPEIKFKVIVAGARTTGQAELAQWFGPPKFWRWERVQTPSEVLFCTFLWFMVDILGVMGPFFVPLFYANIGSRGGPKWPKLGCIWGHNVEIPVLIPSVTPSHSEWCHKLGPLPHMDDGAQTQWNVGLQQAYGSPTVGSKLFFFRPFCRYSVAHFVFSSEGFVRRIRPNGCMRDHNSGYIHSHALIYASLRLLYHILHLLHACFWLKIASLAVKFILLKTF